jgi:hypothetical protein
MLVNLEVQKRNLKMAEIAKSKVTCDPNPYSGASCLTLWLDLQNQIKAFSSVTGDASHGLTL